MQKTRDCGGAEPGRGGTRGRGGGAIHASGRVPPLRRLLGKNPHDELGRLEKKSASRFAITTFSSC